MSKKGMTLNEIVITVVIVGILATLALSMVRNYFEQSEAEVCKTNLKTLKTALDIYAMEHESVPGAMSELAPYVERAYAQVMNRPGAWKVRIACASLQLREHLRLTQYCAAQNQGGSSVDLNSANDNQKYLLQLAKGNKRLITCPKAKGDISYALNANLLQPGGVPLSSRQYQELGERNAAGNYNILIADCDSGVYLSDADISLRHAQYGVLSSATLYGHAAGVKGMLKYQNKQLVSDYK